MMPLHETGEPAPFTYTDDIHFVGRLELVHQDAVTGLEVVVAGSQLEFAEELRAIHAGLLQVTSNRLVNALRLHELDKADLNGIVAIGSRGLSLHHYAGTSLHHGHGNYLPIGPEHLCHPD